MRKVTENTFRTYAVEAVKKINTLEIKATLELTPLGARIYLYRENVEVGYVSILNGGDYGLIRDFTRDDAFNITPDRKSIKSVFEKMYEVVNSLLDNGWFTVEKEEVAEEPTPEEADKEVAYIDFKPEQDYNEEEPKAENDKVEAVAQYLNNKITGWYENTSIYGMSGKFIGCKAEGEHGIRINWEENGKEYTMVINWFTEYPAEQLYNIWMVQDVEVKEVKPEPNKITTQARTYVDDKVQEIRYELTKLEELEEAANVMDAELEKDSENTELYKKWDEAYKEEYQQFKKVYGLVANLVGIDLLTARQIVNGNRDRLKKILGLKKIADLTA